jgi:hypothetical protein
MLHGTPHLATTPQAKRLCPPPRPAAPTPLRKTKPRRRRAHTMPHTEPAPRGIG